MNSKENKTCNGNDIVMEMRDASPAQMLVEIQGVSKLLKHGIQKHQSSAFVAVGYDWTLTICPISDGGSCENEVDRVYVHLSVADDSALADGCTVFADCSILLHNQVSDNFLCFRAKNLCFDEDNPEWGFSISKNMLKEPYVLDDKCVFGAEVFPIEETCTIEGLSLLEWKISNFSKLQGPWSSGVFTMGGLKWRMKLYPNGCGDAKGKSISIYLKCVDHKSFASHEKAIADCRVCLRNSVSRAHRTQSKRHQFTFNDGYLRFLNYIPISDMGKVFMVKDCCFIQTQISTRDVVFTPKLSTHK